jgi:hypothetical protein
MSRFWEELEAGRVDQRVGRLWWDVLTSAVCIWIALMVASRVTGRPDSVLLGIVLLFFVFVAVWFVGGSALLLWALRSIDKMQTRRRALKR